METPSSDEVTRLLKAWSAGDETALEKLLPLVDADLRKIANAYLRVDGPASDLDASELISEVFLRLIKEPPKEWQSPKHFFGIAAYIMREFLVHYARGGLTAKRKGDSQRVPISEAADLPTESENELLALGEALDRLARLDERKSSVVELKYFVGLTIEATAEVLGISQSTVRRELKFARAWLRQELAPEQNDKSDESGSKEHSIVLIPNQVVEPFLSSIPSLLNSAQSEFKFSIKMRETRSDDLAPSKTLDVREALLSGQSLKKNFNLRHNDLLISFISETLESRSRNFTNLFVAVSSLSETPPRVAIISTSFIHRYILPVDPTYLMQRHAFYHLIVCSMAGAFFELPAHQDSDCLMDFNNNAQDIDRKIRAGYTFCDSCTSIIKRHPLGDALFKICSALKVWPGASYWLENARTQNQPRVFLCYAGGDRERVFDLYARLLDDGFKPWMDKKNLVGGQDWQLEIQRAIQSSDFFIACLSLNFQHRTHAHTEIKLALEVLDTMPEGAIYLIPLRLERCEIGARLAHRQCVDLFEINGYENLLKALRWNNIWNNTDRPA